MYFKNPSLKYWHCKDLNHCCCLFSICSPDPLCSFLSTSFSYLPLYFSPSRSLVRAFSSAQPLLHSLYLSQNLPLLSLFIVLPHIPFFFFCQFLPLSLLSLSLYLLISRVLSPRNRSLSSSKFYLLLFHLSNNRTSLSFFVAINPAPSLTQDCMIPLNSSYDLSRRSSTLFQSFVPSKPPCNVYLCHFCMPFSLPGTLPRSFKLCLQSCPFDCLHFSPSSLLISLDDFFPLVSLYKLSFPSSQSCLFPKFFLHFDLTYFLIHSLLLI